MNAHIFLRKWKVEFDVILRREILAQMGFRIGQNGGFSRCLLTREQKLRRLLTQQSNLNDFHDAFVSICEQAGIPLEHSKDCSNLLLPEVLQESHKFKRVLDTMGVSLKRRISRVGKGSTRRWRRRVPAPVAFEVARALHFCSGDKGALDVMKTYLEQPQHLQAQIARAHSWVKVTLTAWLSSQQGTMRKVERHARSHRKYILGAQINEIGFDRMLVSNLEFSWTFLGSREEDLNWAAHLKEHLIRTVLSEGKIKMIKVLGKSNARKQRLIRKMVAKNMRTMKP